MRPRHAPWPLLMWFLAGCATLAPAGPRTAPGGAWDLPAEAGGSQHLYRVQYEGPQRDLSFKLTLYLVSDDRYHMKASDSLGRRLFALDLGQEGATWIDYRNKIFCRTGGGSRLDFIPIAELPLASLPRLLRGHMPAEPAPDSLEQSVQGFRFRDAHGQVWTGGLGEPPAAEGERPLLWWSLQDGGRPVAWWRRQEGGGSFSDSRGQQSLRWQEAAREPLASELPALTIPASYGEHRCADLSYEPKRSPPSAPLPR